MGAVAAAKGVYGQIRDQIARYLANDDPLAAAANTGAFIVWSNQPFYPIYVGYLVGWHAAWPAFVTWLSTALFFSVPLVARRHSLGARALFVAAGVSNTVLSTKAFGTASDVGWFLVPCAIIAATFFRAREWKVAALLCGACALAGVAVRFLGAPLYPYGSAQSTSLSHLNLYSVVVLSAYLLYAAGKARWQRPA
jgi:hypothetical protein